MKRYFWTLPEQAVVRRVYPVLGVAGCMVELPQKSRGAIYQQARCLGLKAPATLRLGRPRQRWFSDAFTDEAITQVYQAAPSRKAVVELALRLGKPRAWVSRRALELGLVVPRFKDEPWCDAELELLHAHAHKSAQAIAGVLRRAGFSRSEGSVMTKRKREAIGVTAARQIQGMYTGNQLAGLLGVDANTVKRWVRLGLLVAGRRGGAVPVQSGDQYEIHVDDVRRFVVCQPQCVDLRKVDRLWFIEMLAGPAFSHFRAAA